MPSVSAKVDELSVKLEKVGQQHLLKFWSDLSENEKESFEKELKEVDLESLKKVYEESKKDKQEDKVNKNIKPVPSSSKSGYEKSSKEELKKYEARGLKAIADGEVAVVLLAGGQATRLGVSYPKGMYSVKLPSEKSLFQLQAERIVRVQELAGAKSKPVNWYVMTSENSKEVVKSYFEKNNYFKVDKEKVHFFEQGTMPCISKDGKVLLDSKSKLSKSSDGNGGLYKALVKSGVLDDLKKRGVKYVHAYCVDNVLVRVADPVFIGYCVEKNADCAAKVVKKTDPEERLGVICKSEDDKFQVVEYSEISEENRKSRDENKDLVYNSGNICNHFFTYEFLEEVCKEHEKKLKYHVAEKKINYVDESGMVKKPVTANGVKFEKFIFDVFQFAKKFAVWEVVRKDEFSPLKNSVSEPSDNELSCKRDVLELHYKWLVNAGVKLVESKSNEDDDSSVEVSPLVSYSGEGLEDLKGKKLKTPVVLEKSEDSKSVTFNGLDLLSYSIKNDLLE